MLRSCHGAGPRLRWLLIPSAADLSLANNLVLLLSGTSGAIGFRPLWVVY